MFILWLLVASEIRWHGCIWFKKYRNSPDVWLFVWQDGPMVKSMASGIALPHPHHGSIIFSTSLSWASCLTFHYPEILICKREMTFQSLTDKTMMCFTINVPHIQWHEIEPTTQDCYEYWMNECKENTFEGCLAQGKHNIKFNHYYYIYNL